MLNIQTTESIVTKLCLVCAYFLSVTLTGAGQAWLAKKMGDSTAEDAGLLSLNPLAHIDALGLGLVILFGFGWGKILPIDPQRIYAPWRSARLMLMYASESLLSSVLALISLVALILMYGPYSLLLLQGMFSSESIPLSSITGLYSDRSSLAIVGASVLLAIIFISVFIASLSLILNSFRYALVIGLDRGYSYVRHADFLMVIAPMIIVLLFANTIKSILLVTIAKSATLMAGLLGAW